MNMEKPPVQPGTEEENKKEINETAEKNLEPKESEFSSEEKQPEKKKRGRPKKKTAEEPLERKPEGIDEGGEKASAEKSEKPQYLEDDPRYKKIVEDLALSRLKEGDMAEFNEKFSGEVSPEGYLLDRDEKETDLKPSEIAYLSFEDTQLAKIQFERSYPQEAKDYEEKEASRIYDNPEKDPLFFLSMIEINAKTNSLCSERYPNDLKKQQEEWLAIKSEVSAPYWEEFAKEYPEKAKAYAEKGHENVKKALEKARKKNLDENQNKSENISSVRNPKKEEKTLQDTTEKTEEELNDIRKKLGISVGYETSADLPAEEKGAPRFSSQEWEKMLKKDKEAAEQIRKSREGTEYIHGAESSASKNQGFVYKNKDYEKKQTEKKTEKIYKDMKAFEKDTDNYYESLKIPITADYVRQEAKFHPEISSYKVFVLRERKTIELFKEFKSLDRQNFESILKTGETKDGKMFKSSAMGDLDPEAAKILASEFKKVRLVPKILLSSWWGISLSDSACEKLDKFFTKKAEEGVAEKKEAERLSFLSTINYSRSQNESKT